MDPGSAMAIAKTAMKVITAATTAYSAYSAVQSGRQQKAYANSMADQQRTQANQAYALRQIEAERMRKNAGRLAKRQQSMLAAGGFAADDVGANVLTEGLVKEATLQELLTLAQGEDAFRQGNYEAQITRARGRDAERAGYVQGVTTLVSGAMDWFDRYGPGKKASAKKHGYSGLYGPEA